MNADKDARIEELERKLAEHELFSEFIMATYGVACGSEHVSMLNKIIAKAKEEGRKEAIEYWELNLRAATKPQGETE